MFRLFCVLSLGLFILPAKAQPIRNYELGHGKILVSIKELPDQVQLFLGKFIQGTSGIADISEKFNPYDTITDSSIPMKRLVRGFISDTCIQLTVEHGGRGYYVEKLEFQLTDNGWVKIETAQN